MATVLVGCASITGIMHGDDDISKNNTYSNDILRKADKKEKSKDDLDKNIITCTLFYLAIAGLRPSESDLQREQELCRACEEAKTYLSARFVEPGVCKEYQYKKENNERGAEVYRDFINSPEFRVAHDACSNFFDSCDDALGTVGKLFGVDISDKK